MNNYTATQSNEWDMLADRFNTHKSGKDVHPDAAVNVHVGWPAITSQIEYQKSFLGKDKLKILDFGCGVGHFCAYLHEKGQDVTGVERSDKMRKIAQDTFPFPDKILSIKAFGDAEIRKLVAQGYDVVTAIHVFDWIENVEEVIESLVQVLKKGGILIFSVFPKEHIKDSLLIKDLFEDFDSAQDPKVGYANFDGVRVKVFVRQPSFYDKLFSSLGFEKIMEFYPPYPKEFMSKYKWTGSLHPEMVILTYRKI
ncbi:MAG: hypothetical protein ACD_22C00062G0010 [uncultured bacterium]|nr:MAG: hypothetical protein ACD_22C00062G0010 [uncultured bacterium]